jgi:hypothetical protein
MQWLHNLVDSTQIDAIMGYRASRSNEMFIVTYCYYGRYQHEKQFDSEPAAKRFFWAIQKRSGVTRTEFRACAASDLIAQ